MNNTIQQETVFLTPSKREYTNHLTGERYLMHTDTADRKILVSYQTGKLLKTFYACAFTGTDVKDNKGKVYNLGAGEFIDTSVIQLTHKKFFIQKRFVKI